MKRRTSGISVKTHEHQPQKKLKCLEHGRELTYICSELDCIQYPLFCDECVEVDHMHLSEHGDKVIPLEMFIRSLEDNPEYRGLRKMNWLMQDLKEMNYLEWLDKTESELKANLEEEFRKLMDEFATKTEQKYKELVGRLNFLLMRQKDHYKYFMKQMQKTSNDIFENQMATCEKLLNDSNRIKTTSELEKMVKDAKKEILKLRIEDENDKNCSDYHRVMEVADQIDFYLKNGIDIHLPDESHYAGFGAEKIGFSDILLDRIDPIVADFFNKFQFTSSVHSTNSQCGSPTRKAIRRQSSNLNFDVSPRKVIKQIESLAKEVKIRNYFTFGTQMKYLHYFQDQTHLLHLVDLDHLHYSSSIKDNPSIFKTIELDINFKIPQGHASIITSSGQLFLTGGDGSNRTYEYDHYNKTLVKRRSMNTLRWGHAICQIDDEIYVIGGRSQECERYSIKRDTWEPIARMSMIVTCPTICVVDNKYIYRFGGFKNNTTERYSVEYDEWKQIELKTSYLVPLHLELTYQAEAVQINEQYLILFGGREWNQAHVFEFDHKKNEDKGMLLHRDAVDQPGEMLFFQAKNGIVFENRMYAITSNGKKLLRYSGGRFEYVATC